jgi:osmotically-inducible protein OsmY
MMDADEKLKREVERELEWDPQIDASRIGVTVKNGAVTLTGYVPKYGIKAAAVRAAERVHGVRAVADEIRVRLPGSVGWDDAAIAEAIARSLRWNTNVPDNVKAEVRDGVVTLRGEVEWEYQRNAAERAVRNAKGVTGVSNLVVVKPKVEKPRNIERRIAEAIERCAKLDLDSLSVTTENGTVRLRGKVRSLHDKRLAEKEASAAPGVSEVDSELEVVP